MAHGLNDALLADPAKVAGGCRLPVGRHVQPDFAGETRCKYFNFELYIQDENG